MDSKEFLQKFNDYCAKVDKIVDAMNDQQEEPEKGKDEPEQGKDEAEKGFDGWLNDILKG